MRTPVPWDDLEDARSQNSVTQHHDAITGTALSFVNDDYFARLRRANANLDDMFGAAVESLIQKPSSSASLLLQQQQQDHQSTVAPRTALQVPSRALQR